MKSFVVLSCALLAVFIGQTVAMSYPVTPSPCGSSNGLEGYKGACDESVPVVVLPKGRPIMESILDWFRCCTGSCSPPTTPPTTPPPTGWTPTPPTGWPTPPPTGTWSPPTGWPTPPVTATSPPPTPPPTGTWVPPPPPATAAPPTGTAPPPAGTSPPPTWNAPPMAPPMAG